jgi:hypothetical protein
MENVYQSRIFFHTIHYFIQYQNLVATLCCFVLSRTQLKALRIQNIPKVGENHFTVLSSSTISTFRLQVAAPDLIISNFGLFQNKGL